MGLRNGAAWGLSASLALAVPVVTMPFGAVAQGAGQSYSRIDVEGNIRVDDVSVLSYAGIGPGTPLTIGQLNAAYQRIMASGLFESVDFDPSGSTLTITVKEFPTVNEIAIEGNRRIDDEALTPLLKSQPRRVYSPSTAEADARAIADAYRQAGRLGAVVTPRIIPRSQNRVDVVFEVTESAVVEVERIAFVGNSSFSDRRLRNVLGTKQAGIFRALVARDQYVEDRIAYDRQVLTDYYRARGFIDFEVTSVSTEFSRERNAFFITFNIREGQQFRFGKVGIASEVPELAAADYEDIVRTRPGQLYSPLRIDDGIARLERKALMNGNDFIQVDPRITRNEADQTLDLTYTLTRGPRIFVERIDIEGNSTTRDEVIRRQFDTVEGDPFNPREIRNAAERIRALNYFSNADVAPRDGTAPDRVIIDVNVDEQPTGQIGFGVNYSVGDGVGGQFSLSERNFLGRGQRLGFSVSGGVDNTAANLSLTEPALLGRDVSGTISAGYSATDQYSSDYSTRKASLSPSLGFRVSDYSRLSLRYTISGDRLYGVSDGDSDDADDNGSSVILQREEGDKISSSVGYTFSFDTRNVGINPDAGIRFQFSQDFAGLGGDVDYIKTSALVGAETKLGGSDVTLTSELQGGALTMLNGQDSWVLDRFGAGSRVRGFSRNGFGPRDTTATNEDALGGNYYTAWRTEVNFPVGLPEEYGVRGGLFFDAGSVWGLDDTAGTGGEVDDDFHLRAVLGASLFWSTPLGPLRFDFTRAVQKESYDDEQTFDFSISTAF
ncbi:outer membrane protein assembly factor BamA [Mangrovicoccus algicola]|uniref:Outer membrane protein assembly factor BamA n=1 Tax=Mangrovicoccus algicola TaxID=2771008 RepID=A0A8J7CVZ0_9RHOB|nr:outer membrane protein assembly factor BamA [Mangrovicoccus algicola]MBE3637077.1 outer membrane protein assembly factor BamA [Mangrovicoccus algicola]